MKLIIINGMPATGKTTVAKSISEQLNIPTIAKDTIKEFLFDTLGVKDREWPRMLGMISSDFLYVIAGTLLADGQSIIIESAFEKQFAKPQIDGLISKYAPEVTEIYCGTEQTVRRQRFMERNQSGNRHVGHMDHVNYLSESEDEPTGKFAPLELQVGKYIHIDTTAPDNAGITEIVSRIES